MARITGKFGEHRSYYKPGKFHEGVDLAFAENTPIKAYGGGKVAFVGVDPNGYGNYMKILANDGTTHLYAHANKFNKKVGDLINIGDAIGLVGSTGRSTGAHLHFGKYKNGKAVDPMDVINQKPQLKQVLGAKVVKTPETDTQINEMATQIIANQAQENALRQQKQQMQQNLLNMVNDVLSQKQTLKTSATTLDDVLNAPTGNKFGAYLDYLASPERIRQTTAALGGYTFDSNGNLKVAGEDWAQSLENAYKKNAKIQNENQSDKLTLLKDVIKELGMDEREANKLQATIDKNNKDYEIDKEKNNIESLYKQGLISNQQKEILIKDAAQKETARHNKAGEGLEGRKIDIENKKVNETVRHNQVSEQNQGNKVVNGKNGQIKMSAADAKTISENRQTIATIDDAIREITKNPNAYTWIKGKLGADITNRLDPSGVKTRSQIDNVTAVYRKWLTGAQMSDKERKDYERFLPAPTDNGKIVKQKLEAMKASIQTKNKALMSQYGQNANNNTNNNPLGLNL